MLKFGSSRAFAIIKIFLLTATTIVFAAVISFYLNQEEKEKTIVDELAENSEPAVNETEPEKKPDFLSELLVAKDGFYTLPNGKEVRASDLNDAISENEIFNGVIEDYKNKNQIIFSTIDSEDGLSNFYRYDALVSETSQIAENVDIKGYMVVGARGNTLILATSEIDYDSWGKEECSEEKPWFVAMQDKLEFLSFDLDGESNEARAYVIPEEINKKYDEAYSECRTRGEISFRGV